MEAEALDRARSARAEREGAARREKEKELAQECATMDAANPDPYAGKKAAMNKRKKENRKKKKRKEEEGKEDKKRFAEEKKIEKKKELQRYEKERQIMRHEWWQSEERLEAEELDRAQSVRACREGAAQPDEEKELAQECATTAAAVDADEAAEKVAIQEKALEASRKKVAMRKKWAAMKEKKELAQERAEEAAAVAAAVAAVEAAVAEEKRAKEEASLKKAAEELQKMQESIAASSSFFRRLSASLLNKLLLIFSRTLCCDSSVTVGKLTYYPILRLGSLRQDVFRGKLANGKFCAIKKQPLSVVQSTDDEVKILQELSHENIVRLHDYEMNFESYFVALEHCHGTLDDLVIPSEAAARSATSDRLPRPLADADNLRGVISQTLAAIKFLHSKDVAHR